MEVQYCVLSAFRDDQEQIIGLRRKLQRNLRQVLVHIIGARPVFQRHALPRLRVHLALDFRDHARRDTGIRAQLAQDAGGEDIVL